MNLKTSLARPQMMRKMYQNQRTRYTLSMMMLRPRMQRALSDTCRPPEPYW